MISSFTIREFAMTRFAPPFGEERFLQGKGGGMLAIKKAAELLQRTRNLVAPFQPGAMDPVSGAINIAPPDAFKTDAEHRTPGAGRKFSSSSANPIADWRRAGPPARNSTRRPAIPPKCKADLMTRLSPRRRPAVSDTLRRRHWKKSRAGQILW